LLVVACILAELRHANCELNWGVFILLAFVGFFVVIVAPAIVWRAQRYKDAHGIRNEILIDLTAGTICCIMAIIWYYRFNGTLVRTPEGVYFDKFFAPRNWLVFFTTISHFTSVVYPISQLLPEWFKFRTRNEDRSSCHSGDRRGSQSSRTDRPNVPQTPEALEKLLRDPEAVEELVQLAVQDFSSENVLAYKEYLNLVDRL
ncbi:hypothetical protein BDB00DRAFT_742708, partial [Zychaea mexicana]|uniref:uncharacterized protein n=1 Tax=Zychaea mexicana TaxID=64656 RepID=UPI0022FF2001